DQAIDGLQGQGIPPLQDALVDAAQLLGQGRFGGRGRLGRGGHLRRRRLVGGRFFLGVLLLGGRLVLLLAGRGRGQVVRADEARGQAQCDAQAARRQPEPQRPPAPPARRRRRRRRGGSRRGRGGRVGVGRGHGEAPEEEGFRRRGLGTAR